MIVDTSSKAADAMNVIASMASASKAKKGKDAKPEVNEPALDPTIDEYIARRTECETAEALRDAAAGQIIACVRPKRLELCVGLGKVAASVLVNGRLTFTQQKRYSVVPESRGEVLAEAFGDDHARYFKPTLKISLKESSANDEGLLLRLIDQLGADFFQGHFEVKRDLIVQEAFHNDYTTRAEVQAIAQPFIDEETIRPYSPSLKIK